MLTGLFLCLTLFFLALPGLRLTLLLGLTLLLLPSFIALLHLLTTLLSPIAVTAPLLRLCGDRSGRRAALFGLLLSRPLLLTFLSLLAVFAAFFLSLLAVFAAFFLSLLGLRLALIAAALCLDV